MSDAKTILEELHQKVAIGWIKNDGKAYAMPSHFNGDSCITAALEALLAGLLAEMPEKQDMERFETTGDDGGIDTTIFDSDEPAADLKNGETLAHLAQFASDTGWNNAVDACLKAITRYFGQTGEKG